MRSKLSFLAISLIVFVTCIPVFAQQATDSAQQAQMMEQYMQLAQPGEEHKLLEKMAGKWDVTFNMWMAPGQAPMVATGSSDSKMILGGRILLNNGHTEGGGMTTDIMTILGYDKRHKVYTMVSYDSWGTYYVTASGTYNAETKTLVMSGEDLDPIAGFKQVYDFVFKYVSDDKMVFEVIFKNPELTHGQAEFKSVEVTYTKPKK